MNDYLIQLIKGEFLLKTIKPQDFTEIIEDIVLNKNMTYIDAISYYCEQNKMEPETAGKLVQGVLSNKNQVPSPFFLPFNLNLEVEGISGIKLYETVRSGDKSPTNNSSPREPELTFENTL